ncbi:NAD(P)/FAD-dependent oxidoreductase [Nitriliruptoraceae bacterium ZYF776]|nr:NAD(P)/FAD-dependent oxidoreductase [Profundirhabdus halotolerans]
MPEPRSYDVVVLGAGPAGENAADYAHQRGLSVAIVERELVGGECSYWACMPSKALLGPPAALAAARRLPGAAAAVTGDLDVEAVLASRDAAAANWQDDGQVSWLDGAGIHLLRGHGRLVGEQQVEVESADGEVVALTARRGVVVATGSAAARPPIDGLDEAAPWSSRDVTAMQTVPERLLVIGGGVVGVEMAQAARSLGAHEVTIVQADARLLPPEEPFVGEHLRAALEADGIEVLTDAQAQHVRRDGTDGPVTLVLADGRELVGDELLVATGRTPRTADLGLEVVGVTPGARGHLDVDDHLRVGGRDWLYAVGDVNGRAPLTHHGKYQARLVGDALAGVAVDPAWADERALTRVVFTDPQVAAVGWTEQRARDAGRDVLTVRYDLGHTAGGSLQGEGFGGPAQLVVDRERRTVLGATFVGPGAGDHLHAATIAVVSEVTVDRLAHAVPAFPTVSEVWLRLLEEIRKLDLG